MSLPELRFSQSGAVALCHARLLVSQWGIAVIEPEHVLLGILRAERTLVSEQLNSEWTAARLRSVVKERLGPRRPRVSTAVEVPFATATKQVMSKAFEIAASQGSPECGAIHLLAALVQDGATPMGQLLRECGLSPDGLLGDDRSRRRLPRGR